jgi:hypothetical protein
MPKRKFEIRRTPEGALETKPFQLVIGYESGTTITTVGLTADEVIELGEVATSDTTKSFLEQYLLDMADAVTESLDKHYGRS